MPDASFVLKRGLEMQYSKFMANLYQYDENITRGISGVARFEAAKSVKIGLKLCFPRKESGVISVFLISKKGRAFTANLIFEGKIQQRVFSMQRMFPEEDLKTMGIRPEEIKGVCVIFSNRKFAAFWETDKVDLDSIEFVKKEEETPQEISQEKDKKSEQNQNIVLETNEDVNTEVKENMQESMPDDAEVKDNRQNNIQDYVEVEDNKQNNMENAGAGDKEDGTEENLPIEEAGSDVTTMENNDESDNVETASEPDDSEESSPGEKVNLMKLRELPRDAWILGNNSFLLHGYYNYRYIYLKKEKDRWIVGVPGVFYPQEERAAKIFGFPDFMPVGSNRKRKGVFGYWCKSIAIRE